MLWMIPAVALAFVPGMAFMAWRSWPWFGTLVLLFQLGGLLALGIALLLGGATEVRFPRQALSFSAWLVGEVLLLAMLLAAAVAGLLMRGMRRLLARQAAASPGAERRWR